MLNVAQFIAVWNVWCFSKLIICISSTVAKVHAVNSAPSNVYLIQQRSSNVSVLIGIYNYCLCRVRPRVASVSQFYNSLYLTLPTYSYLPTYVHISEAPFWYFFHDVWCLVLTSSRCCEYLSNSECSAIAIMGVILAFVNTKFALALQWQVGKKKYIRLYWDQALL